MSLPGASGADSLLPFALGLAEAASAEILPRFRHAGVEQKADGSEVTEADRSAERAMRALISHHHPDHGVLGEEAGESAGSGRFQWILDPIDGTASFALGVPNFGTLIALAEGRRLVLGVVYLPVTGETLWAERGGGCWYRDGEAAPVRAGVDASVTRLDRAYISASGVHESEISPGRRSPPIRLGSVVRSAARFRFVGDCIQHMLVARGRLHAAIDPAMAPWDSAALVPCLEEAGATVTSIDGTAAEAAWSGSLLASATPELHAELVERLLPQERDGRRRGESH